MADSALSQLDTLPPLPYVAHQILVSINEKDPSIASIGAALSREPGLTARIVAMANSAFFANQSPVYGAEEAVMRIGINRVRVLAASMLLAQQFDARRCPPFRSERYWYDAVSTAFTAARLARHVALPEGEEAAYLGGLLHNIGLLLLAHAFPGELASALRTHEAAPGPGLAERCREQLEVDHHQAGRQLLTAWGLPDAVVAVAAHYRDSEYDGEHHRLAHTVRIAAQWSHSDFERLPDTDTLPELPRERLEAVARACLREREQLEAFARLLARG